MREILNKKIKRFLQQGVLIETTEDSTSFVQQLQRNVQLLGLEMSTKLAKDIPGVMIISICDGFTKNVQPMTEEEFDNHIKRLQALTSVQEIVEALQEGYRCTFTYKDVCLCDRMILIINSELKGERMIKMKSYDKNNVYQITISLEGKSAGAFNDLFITMENVAFHPNRANELESCDDKEKEPENNKTMREIFQKEIADFLRKGVSIISSDVNGRVSPFVSQLIQFTEKNGIENVYPNRLSTDSIEIRINENVSSQTLIEKEFINEIMKLQRPSCIYDIILCLKEGYKIVFVYKDPALFVKMYSILRRKLECEYILRRDFLPEEGLYRIQLSLANKEDFFCNRILCRLDDFEERINQTTKSFEDDVDCGCVKSKCSCDNPIESKKEDKETESLGKMESILTYCYKYQEYEFIKKVRELYLYRDKRSKQNVVLVTESGDIVLHLKANENVIDL